MAPSPKTTLSALPADVQKLIAQKTLTVNDLSMRDIANIIELKTKNSVFRAVDILPTLIKFFADGHWDDDDTNFEIRISWRPVKENTLQHSIYGEIYVDENKILFNNVTAIDNNGVATSRFSKPFNETEMKYIRKRYLSKGWNFAFLVAAHYQYPRLVTKQACMDFFDQFPEAGVFKQFLSKKQKSASKSASASPILSPKSQMLAEGERFIQQRRKEMKEEAESIKKQVLGHDAAVRTYITSKKPTKTANSSNTRRYNLRSYAKAANK